MAGLNYVGADYTEDVNLTDLVSKLDVDSQIAAAPVSRIGVQSVINDAIGQLASQEFVNNSLTVFAQTSNITTDEAPLIPLTRVGVSGGIAPLDGTGRIPSQFIPSLGVGYCEGPYGPTAIFTATAGAAPVKICDWSIGVLEFAFQPVVFMSLLASAISGGRPVVEVRMSAGSATYNNQVLIARGVGRNSWNDYQTITVLPSPSATGHTGALGNDYPLTFNVWLTAWLYDQNAQQVAVSNSNIVTAGAYFIRTST